jgi:hypothetical protein
VSFGNQVATAQLGRKNATVAPFHKRMCVCEFFLLVARAIQRMLLKEGLLWVDDQAPGGGTWYWSMCLTDGMDADLRESMSFGDTADTGIPPVHA